MQLSRGTVLPDRDVAGVCEGRGRAGSVPLGGVPFLAGVSEGRGWADSVPLRDVPFPFGGTHPEWEYRSTIKKLGPAEASTRPDGGMVHK